MVEVFLSLGSNVDREQNIAAALQALANHFGQLTLSPLYESPSIDGCSNDYLNMAVGFVCDLSLHKLRQALKQIEEQLGRDRKNLVTVNIDIDIAIYGDVEDTFNDEFGGYQIPHPDILKYPHALLPLANIAGDFIHPANSQTLKDCAMQCDKNRIQQIA